MVKPSIDILSRAKEFAEEGFYVTESNTIMCQFCNGRVDWKKKDTCQKHCKSVGHTKAKATARASCAPLKRQATLEGSFEVQKKAKTEKVEFVQQTTAMALKANIPLEKLDHPAFREWMRKYIPGSGDLPTANCLRRNYVPKVGEETVMAIKERIKGKKIAIMCDETTDRKGRAVFAVLAQTMEGTVSQECMLLSCNFLERVNATVCSQAIIDTLSKYEIQYSDVLAFASDSARYMIKCFDMLSVLVGSHVLQIKCWAHKLNLIGDIWQFVLKDTNNLVCKTKNAFLNTRKLKTAYLAFIKDKHPQVVPKLYPEPVLTRWNSWFLSVVYINDYFDVLLDFLCKAESLNPQAKTLKSFMQDKTDSLKTEVSFVAENCGTLVDLITFTEIESSPVAHLLMSRLEELKCKFSLLAASRFGDKTSKMLCKLLGPKRAQLEVNFKKCGERSLSKLQDQLKSSQTTEVYSALSKLFDPSKISCGDLPDTATLKKLMAVLPTFPANSSTYESTYASFHNSVKEMVQSSTSGSCDISLVLQAQKSKGPNNLDFGIKVLTAIWLPVSNVNSERFFSKYGLVVSDRRTSMKEDAVETCNMLYFNN